MKKNKANQRNKEMRTKVTKARKQYKDTVFRMLFKEEDRLRELYHAVAGQILGIVSTDEEKLEIVTLENAVYLGMKNDLAFLIHFHLYLCEHQSTMNINMPYRFLEYITDEYARLTSGENIYGTKRIELPTPHFIVFYNGTAKQPERRILKLSDSFQMKENHPKLELEVLVLNINAGYNEALKKQCKTLGEYMQYVNRVRKHAFTMPTDEAVDKAVDECIAEGILRDFLLANKAEVKRMSIYEYDEEATRKAIRETEYERGMEDGRLEGKIEGKIEGKASSIIDLLEELGVVSEEIKDNILSQTDEMVLSRWLKAAARAVDLKEWERMTREERETKR